jgi:eukaryotic-like serine/threonine-protein kinase
VLAVARALGYAHGKDLIHRDIKPDNILLAFPPRNTPPTSAGFPVQVKVTDLGMAKVFDDDLDLTQTGYGVGTPCYMPLEQAKNSKDVDGRCDIYALGCVLYNVLTGNPPFTGATLVDLIQAKEANTFRPARRFNASVPQRLDLIIYKMVAKSPRDRYQTCAELIKDLESLQLAHPNLCLPRPETPPRKSSPADSSTGGETPPSPESVASSAVPTQVMGPDETGGDVWYIRYRSKAGRVVKQTMTTSQVLAWIASEHFDPTTQASRNPESGFRALAGYREFKAAVLPRVTRAGADERSTRLRTLVREVIKDEDTSAGRKGSPVKGWRHSENPRPPDAALSLPKLLLIVGVLLGLALLVVVVLTLLGIF